MIYKCIEIIYTCNCYFNIIYINKKSVYTDLCHYNIIVITAKLNFLSFIRHPQTNFSQKKINLCTLISVSGKEKCDFFLDSAFDHPQKLVVIRCSVLQYFDCHSYYPLPRGTVKFYSPFLLYRKYTSPFLR